MSIRVWWSEWRAEFRRRRAIDALPVRFALSLVTGGAFLGRFFAGVSGAGMAISISVIFSSYTSLTTVDMDHICLASQFVSRVVQEGRIAAWQFFGAGLLALIAASVPRAGWVYRNIKLHDLGREDTQAIPFKKWASGLSETQVGILFVIFQMPPLLLASTNFTHGLGHVFGSHLSLSPEAIQSMWKGFQSACSH